MDNAFSADYYRERAGQVEIRLHLKGWKEGESGLYFLYSPSLDLTGYGESQEKAKASFLITLDEFLEYTRTKNTLFDELEHLGWAVNRLKRKVYGPELEDLMEDNETLRQLIRKEGVYDFKLNENLQIA